MSRVDRTLQGPARQRGVTAVFAALSLVTLLSAVGLAIDIGQLYYADRDLQRLADLAAIDGARVQSQCLGSAGTDAVDAEVAASLARNRLPQGASSVTRVGRQVKDTDGLRVFRVNAAQEPADSVQVTLSRPSPARILPLFAGDDSRTLTVQAAAKSAGSVSADVSQFPSRAEAIAGFNPRFGVGPLRVALGNGVGSIRDIATASVSVSDVMVVDTSEAAQNLPDLDVPVPVDGFLRMLSDALNATGDAAAASVVDSYAAAVATARPGSSVIPAEVFGIDARGGYDGATANVGAVLDAVNGAVSGGDVVQLQTLCDLVPAVRTLPTAQLLPTLCDTSVRMSIPQPGRPGSSSSSSTPILDVTDGTSDDARTASGLIEVNLRLVNPINGQPIRFPLRAAISGGAVTEKVLQACARLDQPYDVAEITAHGATATFTIGDSGRFDASFGTPGVDVTDVLDDAVATPILSVTLRDLLTSAGLGAIANSPLFAGFTGQTAKVTAFVAPIRIGDDRSETFCMQAPPLNVAERCNGRPSAVGGTSAAEVGRVLPDALAQVQLKIELPPNLPLGLSTALQGPLNTLTTTLSENLGAAIKLIVPELLIPVFEGNNLALGQTYVYLSQAGADQQPQVYAQ